MTTEYAIALKYLQTHYGKLPSELQAAIANRAEELYNVRGVKEERTAKLAYTKATKYNPTVTVNIQTLAQKYQANMRDVGKALSYAFTEIWNAMHRVQKPTPKQKKGSKQGYTGQPGKHSDTRKGKYRLDRDYKG